VPSAEQHLGGRYDARQNSDGTVDIFGVPIVGELRKGERRDLPEFEITEEWLKAALGQAQKRFSEGYLPPLHVHHHGDEFVAPRAGFFISRRVGDFVLNGNPIKTIFADFLRVPKTQAEMIMRGELPYCSVEVLNTEGTPEIDSLALLDSEPPQFRYPLITIGRLMRAKSSDHSTESIDMETAVVGTHAMRFGCVPNVPGAAAALFRYARTEGITMADATNTKHDNDKLKANVDVGPIDEPVAAPGGDEGMPSWVSQLAATIVEGVSAALRQRDEDQNQMRASDDEGETPVEINTDDDPEPEVTVTTEDEESVKAALEDDIGDEPGVPKFTDPGLEERLVARAIRKLEAKFNSRLSSSAGEIAGLKANLKARDEADARESRIKVALKALRGINLDEKSQEDLSFAAGLGQEATDRFVAMAKRSFSRDPEEDLDSLIMSTERDHESVAQFAAKGPDALKAARTLERNWRDLSKRGLVRMSLERYLACNEPMIQEAAV